MEGIGGVIRRRKADEASKSRPSAKGNHLPGIEMPKKEKYIHSEAHALAAEISSYFGEKQKFGVYLGVIKRIGVAQARTTFASIKTEGNVRNPRKFFMWMSKLPPVEHPIAAVPKTKKPRKKRGGKQLDLNDFFS